MGDWDCNLNKWRMGRGVHRCWACGGGHKDLAHYMLECREFQQGRDWVAGVLKEVSEAELWEQWAGVNEEMKVAEKRDREKGWK